MGVSRIKWVNMWRMVGPIKQENCWGLHSDALFVPKFGESLEAYVAYSSMVHWHRNVIACVHRQMRVYISSTEKVCHPDRQIKPLYIRQKIRRKLYRGKESGEWVMVWWKWPRNKCYCRQRVRHILSSKESFQLLKPGAELTQTVMPRPRNLQRLKNWRYMIETEPFFGFLLW